MNDDEKIDSWHEGYDAHLKGKPCPTEENARAGWLERERSRRVHAVLPERPEGYYHMPIGTFD